jgi:glycosyltransferase involved in cell wall biosynthesis
MRILVVSSQMVRPDQASGDLRLSLLLDRLREHGEVLFLTREVEPAEDTQEQVYWTKLRGQGIQILPSSWYVDPVRVFSYARLDVVFAEFWTVGDHILQNWRVGNQLQPWIRILVDSVDVHFLREEAALNIGQGDADAVAERKGRELSVYTQADGVIVVSQPDREALLRYVSDEKLFVLPNIVKLRHFTPSKPHNASKTILFVGGFSHSPNSDAVLWFVRDIFPKVSSQIPEAQFAIVGSNPGSEILSLSKIPGVNVVGYVEDTAPWLDSAAVSIAPLRYGGGMKGKVTEALASALPVVATDFGAQGLEVVDGIHLKLANSEESFAEAVIWSLQNPNDARLMGLRGQKLVNDQCGETAVGASLASVLRDRPSSRRNSKSDLRFRTRVLLLRSAMLFQRIIRGMRRASSALFDKSERVSPEKCNPKNKPDR